MRSITLFILITLLITSCTRNNVNNKAEYKPLFEKYGVRGCWGMLDNSYNQFSVYNLKRFRDSAYSPASTFKIVNSLIGIETGKLDEKALAKWDGVDRGRPEWNQDQDFTTAFKNSTVWYFQALARRIGKDTMQRYLDTLSYGSKKIIGAVDSFWLNNSLTIKPDEQMGLVKKLYFTQFGKLFSNRTMSKVKDAMLVEKTDKYALSYKSGLGTTKAGIPMGWVIGWVEYGINESRKINFFVLNIEGSKTDNEMIELRKKLLFDLLKAEKVI